MYAIACRYTNEDEAKDVIQDAFIQIFNKIHTLKEPDTLPYWIKRIVINTALNQNRKNAKHLTDIPIDDCNIADESMEILDGRHSAEEVKTILLAVPEHYRTVFNLFVFEEYTHAEISTMLSINESTSKSRLFRAREILKKQLIQERITI